MADRRDYFFKQKVTEAELDVGFDTLEQAERNLSLDLGFTGIVLNGAVTENSPQDLQVFVSGPLTARSPLGERLTFPAPLLVDLSTDGNLPVGAGGTGDGVSTAVAGSGNERWIGVFMVFDRILSDNRTDGNGLTVSFVRTESFHFVIVASAEATAPILIAAAPATPAGAIRYADVRLAFGQTQIANADIDLTNRDDVIRGPADEISVVDSFPNLSTPVNDVQETLEALDVHAGLIEDPHGPDNTFSGQMVIGRTGVPEPALTRIFEAQVEGAAGPEFAIFHDVNEELTDFPLPAGGSGFHMSWLADARFLAGIRSPGVDEDTILLSLTGMLPAIPNNPKVGLLLASGMVGEGSLFPADGKDFIRMHLKPRGIAPGPLTIGEAQFFSGTFAAPDFDGATIKAGGFVMGGTGTGGVINAGTGFVLAQSFRGALDVRNITLPNNSGLHRGQFPKTIARISAAGALVGADDVNIDSIAHTSTGLYELTYDLTVSGVALACIDGTTPGFITTLFNGGQLDVRTFNTSGTLTDLPFYVATIGGS